jgi:hypothetical protein
VGADEAAYASRGFGAFGTVDYVGLATASWSLEIGTDSAAAPKTPGSAGGQALERLDDTYN